MELISFVIRKILNSLVHDGEWIMAEAYNCSPSLYSSPIGPCSSHEALNPYFLLLCFRQTVCLKDELMGPGSRGVMPPQPTELKLPSRVTLSFPPTTCSASPTMNASWNLIRKYFYLCLACFQVVTYTRVVVALPNKGHQRIYRFALHKIEGRFDYYNVYIGKTSTGKDRAANEWFSWSQSLLRFISLVVVK